MSSASTEEKDVDVDAVSYGFMASQALFTGLETGVFDAIAVRRRFPQPALLCSGCE